MSGLIDTERKGCESPIHDHAIDICVTMEGWVDAPDSDQVTQGVDVSSTYLVILASDVLAPCVARTSAPMILSL